MIGVKFQNIETYKNFINFREKWYIDTKMVFTKKDIADKVDYVISDIEIPNTSTKTLIYGKDIQEFEDLSNYTQLIRNGEIKDDSFISQLSLLENLEIDVDIADDLIEDINSDFEGYELDSEKYLTPEESLKRLELQRQAIEKLKRQREADELLEQERLEKKRLQEEQERKERERKEQEEREEQERKYQQAIEEQRKEQERLLAEEKHKLELEQLEKQRQIELELEQQRKRVELEQLELEKQKELAELEARSKGIQLAKNNLAVSLNFREPKIPDSLLPQKQSGGRIRIGSKKNNNKTNVYLVGSTLADVGGTTIAYNLAYSLKRNNPNEVLFIDLDFLTDSVNKIFDINEPAKYSIANAFTEDYVDFIQNIEYSVAKTVIEDRELLIMTSIKYNDLTAQDAKVIDNYDFTRLIRSLSTKFKTIVVDIGSLSNAKQYQKLLLSSLDFKKILVYNGESKESMNNCVASTERLLGEWKIILSKASKNINSIKVEKNLGKTVLGIIPQLEQYYADLTIIEKNKNSNIVNSWSEIVRNV